MITKKPSKIESFPKIQGIKLLRIKIIFCQIFGEYFFFEGVGSRFGGASGFNHFDITFNVRFFKGCNNFLCHNDKLFDFFVNRYLFEIGIVFFQLHSFRGIFFILFSDIARDTGNVGVFLLGTFHDYLYSISF